MPVAVNPAGNASVAESLPRLTSPPPPTTTVFVTVAAASCPTATVSVIAGYAPPDGNPSTRVQLSGSSTQVHPEPVRPLAVNPGGRTSATVTMPLALPAPVLLTVSVYEAP